jgi:hypothetical protein
MTKAQKSQGLEGRLSGPRVAKGGDASSVWPSASHLSLDGEEMGLFIQEQMLTNRLIQFPTDSVNHLVQFGLKSLVKC